MNPLARRTVLYIQQRLRGFDGSAAGYLDVSLPVDQAPIFLIGAPRTGSTLVFQLLVRQFHVSYISNVMAAAPRLMVRLCRLSPRFCTGFDGGLRNSEFGFVPGLYAPNEAGQIMQQWFGDDPAADSPAQVRGMVAAVTNAGSAPLFLKNQSNTVRLDRIKEIFPDARLLFLRRDLRWTAQSLLLARRKLFGDERQWWSVAPPGYEAVTYGEPLYQVLWQADQLEQIALDACAATPARAAVLDYEELCARPAMVMAAVGERFGLRPTGAPAPALCESQRQRLSADEWDRLEELYQTHFEDSVLAREKASAPMLVGRVQHLLSQT
jgi:hypothetical protein